MTMQRAVVIGGSIAGLCAARVLADWFDRVTVVDRDAYPVGPLERAGVRGLRRVYHRLPAISIDRGVLERAHPVVTVRARFPWSDVGSWAAVHRLMSKDAHGIAGNGPWLELGAKNCLIHAPDRLVVLLGIEDAVIVDTPDALLVGDLERSQDVRELVDALNRKGFGSYTIK
jgi:hypothetical protein